MLASLQFLCKMSVLYSDVIWYHLNCMGIQTNPSKLQSVTSVFTGTRLSAATKNSTILNCFHHYSSHQELSLAEPSKFKNPYSTTKLACQVLLSWGKNFLWELNFANFAVFSKIHEIKLLQSFSKWTIRKIEFLQNFKKSSNHEIKFPQNFSKLGNCKIKIQNSGYGFCLFLFLFFLLTIT